MYLESLRHALSIDEDSVCPDEVIERPQWLLFPVLCAQAAGGDPKPAEDIAAAWALLYTSAHILDKIEDTVGRVFHLDKLHMHSFTLAGFLSLRDIFEFEEDFVFLDISGEVTDISFVKDGVLKEVQTFPLGRNSFIREVVKNFGNTYELATSMLRSSGFNELDEKTELKLNDALSDVRKEWGRNSTADS